MFLSSKKSWLTELFSTQCWSLNQYISILSKHSLLQFINAEEFCRRIEDKCGTEASKEFLLQFKADVANNRQQNAQPLFSFPLHSQSDQAFEKIKLQTFADSYLEQRKQQESKLQVTKAQHDPPQAPQESQELHFFDFPGSDDNKEFQTLVKSEIAKETNNKVKPKGNKKKIIPPNPCPVFFTNCYKALNQLLQLNLTDYFKEELNEIKELILRQINDSHYLKNIYETYLIEYQQIHYIRSEGSCYGIAGDRQQLKKNIDHYFHEYLHKSNKRIRYMPGFNESFLLKTWNTLQENTLAIMRSKTKNIRKKVKEILIKGMEKIFLTYQLDKRIYAHLNQSKFIFISLNHKGRLRDEEFFKQPMKSYVTLCIFHQLGHFLVRNYEECPFGNKDSSFSTEISTIGNALLENIQQYAKNKPQEYFIDKEKLKNYQIEDGLIIRQLAVQLHSTIERHQQLFDVIKVHAIDYKKIDQKLQLFRCIAKEVSKIIFSKGSPWKDIYNYIDELLVSTKNQPTGQLIKKEEEYTFFFSIFFIFEDIVGEWLMQTKQDVKTYREYKEKLANNVIQFYYIKDTPIIDEFIHKINQQTALQQFPNNKMVVDFNKYFRANKCPANHLNTCTSQFLNSIGSQRIIKCRQDLTALQSKIISILPHFKRKSFAEIRRDQLDILPDPLQRNSLLASFLEIKEIHKKYMQLAKHAEVLTIYLQLPPLLTVETNGDRKDKFFQSKSILQRRLFPKFQGDKIYAKDFQLIKNIELNYQKIGETPISFQEQQLNIWVGKGGREQESYVDLCSPFGCNISEKRLRKQGITYESWIQMRRNK